MKKSNQKGKGGFSQTTVLIVSALTCIVIVFLAAFFTLSGSEKGTPSSFIWNSSLTFNVSDSNFITNVEVDGEADIKVLCITDTQISFLGKRDVKRCLTWLVEKTQPDIIVHLGDMYLAKYYTAKLKWTAALLDSFGLPWALTLGNHDVTGNLDYLAVTETLMEYEHCLVHKSPSNVSGATNYMLSVNRDGKPLYTFTFLDTHSTVGAMDEYIEYEGRQENDYGYLTASQIEWASWSVKSVSKYYGKSIPNAVFMHVPLCEYDDAWNKRDGSSGDGTEYIYGEKNEGSCPPSYNSGYYDVINADGVTTDVFCGHDHINSFRIKYGNVFLNYALKTGVCSYNDDKLNGATLLTIPAAGGSLTAEQIHYEG